MAVLLGTNAYPTTDEAARRQAEALATWRAVDDVVRVNLQFVDEAFGIEGFATHAGLHGDSVGAAGRPGIRKPVASEVFSVLAQLAAARGCRYFLFVNSDIQATPSVVQILAHGDLDAYLFSRMDFDGGTGRDHEVQTAGIDGFAVQADWWLANRFRFRPYIVGEPVWDNVYAAQMLTHGRSVLLNREAYIRHERHPRQWARSPFAHYIQLLSALDAPYFSLWYTYWTRLGELRERGASEAEELALQADVFVWRPSFVDRVMQHGRMLKAHARYQIQQHRSAFDPQP